MKDSSDIKQTYVYKLSCNDKLHYFSNVVLVSSHQDRFVQPSRTFRKLLKFYPLILVRISRILTGFLDVLANFYTVKPRFTGPLGGKGLGPVNREARSIGVHFTLICT